MTTALQATPDTERPEVPVHLKDLYDEAAALSDKQLLGELQKSLTITAEHVARIATFVRCLEERGINVFELRIPRLQEMRRVAYGQTLPELVANSPLSGLARTKAMGMPLPDQKRLVLDEPISVVEIDEEGPTHRLVRPSLMSKDQVRQVFAQDHQRDESEQIAFLNAERDKKRRSSNPDSGVVIDQKRKCIVVSGDHVSISLKELGRFIERLSS